MKLIKGKKVRIIDSSEFWKITRESELNNNFMCGYCGKIATIVIVHNEGDSCSLDIDGKAYCWNKDYLMPYRQRKSDNIKKVVKPKTRKMWAAMDEGTNAVYLYGNRPVLLKTTGMWDNKSNDHICMNVSKEIAKIFFPKLTIENSPQKVNVSFELIIK